MNEGVIEIGKCDICGKENVILARKYYHYDINCECHNPTHFEIVWYCGDCIPKEPKITKLYVKTEELKKYLSEIK